MAKEKKEPERHRVIEVMERDGESGTPTKWKEQDTDGAVTTWARDPKSGKPVPVEE